MKKYIKFIVPITCAIIIFLFFLLTGNMKAKNYADYGQEYNYVFLDAISCTGIILLLFGCFIWLTTAGSLDMLIYGVNILFRSIFNKLENYPRTYYDYVENKRDVRENNKPCLWPTFLIGLLLLLVYVIIRYGLKLEI